MATPHISSKKEQIAKTVLMPGDPLRAKMAAETFLDNPILVNSVRNIYAYTGTYKGKEVTIMASGMGMPSIGIYSYELYKEYDVENIIRIGSAGAYVEELDLFDIMLVTDAYSESSYAKTQNGTTDDILKSSDELNDKIIAAAKANNITLKIGRVHSSDVFYRESDEYLTEVVDEKGCKCVEMESFALFHNANVLRKKATCLLTISDSFVKDEKITAEERQSKFTDMIKLALEAV